MSGWYLDGKEKLLARLIPPEALIYVVGVNDEYVFSPNHILFTAFEDNIILPEQLLTTTTFDLGVLRADNPQWLNAGQDLEGISLTLQGVIIYFKLEDAGTLLAFIDAAEAGLPQNLVGVNVTAFWHEDGILIL